MFFDRKAPSEALATLVKEYWIYENPETSSNEQKVVPDGFSEIIIHYGDTYQIKLTDLWEDQDRCLFSNQISRFFFLRNTGASGMIGIKLYPWAFFQLFGVDQSGFIDRISPLGDVLRDSLPIGRLTDPHLRNEERITTLDHWLTEALKKGDFPIQGIDQLVTTVMERNGLIGVEEMSDLAGTSSRQLERNFKKIIGITPKLFCRIIRFNFIFQVMKANDQSWVEIALKSGYFDQSHFIKDFKTFTGEEPSAYGFDQKNLANFFLKK